MQNANQNLRHALSLLSDIVILCKGEPIITQHHGENMMSVSVNPRDFETIKKAYTTANETIIERREEDMMCTTRQIEVGGVSVFNHVFKMVKQGA